MAGGCRIVAQYAPTPPCTYPSMHLPLRHGSMHLRVPMALPTVPISRMGPIPLQLIVPQQKVSCIGGDSLDEMTLLPHLTAAASKTDRFSAKPYRYNIPLDYVVDHYAIDRFNIRWLLKPEVMS